MHKTEYIGAALFAVGIAGFGAIAAPAGAGAAIVVVKGSIQAAVDSASPGDTVVVPPGTYHESVLVATDNLTILGSRAAVIDASGFEEGIRVGTGSISTDPTSGLPVCPPIQVHNFTIRGLT